jgi:hypothetical protein
MKTLSKTVNLIIPEEVIEKAVDKYLEGIFGREVLWVDLEQLNKYRITVEEYMAPPLELPLDDLEIEDEW